MCVVGGLKAGATTAWLFFRMLIQKLSLDSKRKFPITPHNSTGQECYAVPSCMLSTWFFVLGRSAHLYEFSKDSGNVQMEVAPGGAGTPDFSRSHSTLGLG